jgi:hypothetical protein
MQSRVSDFVRAFLPLVPLAMCPVCGSRDESTSSVVAQTANSAPSIAGVAPTNASVGSPYSFAPAVTDADGDALVFSATNLPPWAVFDAQTGRIHGTPTAADAGSYESISITVADASHRVSTQDFSIVVGGNATAVATITWSTPFLKVDGTNLDDLAGFRILYGRDPEDLDHSVYIPDPAAHSYEFATLASGAWYFAIVAVDAGGLEGPPTTSAMKVI